MSISSGGSMSMGSGLGSSSSGRDSGGQEGAAGAIFLIILAVGSLLLLQDDVDQRILLAISAGAGLFTLLLMSPQAGLTGTMLFLGLLGGIKRWLIPVMGFSSFDPLMLVGPAIASLYFVRLLVQRQIPRDTRLSNMVFAFSALTVLEILNPLQGGPTVGVAGALFYLVPMFWFYLGRTVGTPRLMKSSIGMAFFISVAGALYGNYQQWFGMLDCEKLWMRYTGWSLLYTQHTVKVFSFFCSTNEYSAYFCVGVVICFVGVLQRRVLAIPGVVAFAIGLFFTGSRGPIVWALVGCVAAWAVLGRNMRSWWPRLIIAFMVALVALYVSLSQVKAKSVVNTTARDLTQHQLDGLLNPLGKNSTGEGHVSLVSGGILFGFTHPLGAGPGASTLGSRLGHDPVAGSDSTENFGSEADIPNAFVSFGFIGGFLYVAILYQIIRSLIKRWYTTREPLYLTLIGIMACQGGAYLIGAHYSMMLFFWFNFGALDRMDAYEQMKRLREERQGALPSGTQLALAGTSATV